MLLSDDVKIRLDRVHTHDVVVLVEIHPVHAAGVAPHRSHFRLPEEDRLALVAGQKNHFLPVGELRADQLVLAVQGDGDDARRAGVGEFRQRRLLHRAAPGGHKDELVGFFQIAGRHQRGKFFVFLEFYQAGNRLAARRCRGLRQFVNLQPVHSALRGKQQNVAVRRSDKEVLHEIFFFRLRADAPLAAARLVPVGIRGGALDVAGMAHGDQHFRVGDEVLEFDFIHFVDDLRAAIIAIRFVHFAQLGGDDLPKFLVARQDLAQFGDQFANGLQFLENFVDGELRQPMQL